MQAYALARPAVRFRLHVLKATNNKADFMYAPKANSNIEDAVLKVIGKECALQCDWTAIEDDGFEIHAFLPKSTATGAKIANQGAFISVDARPVSCSRGTMKQMVSAFKEKLREKNTSLSNVKDPFFCMNIICPPGSYDPNIEPAKDDVMFDNGSLILQAVRKLLEAYYLKPLVQDEDDAPTSAQQPPQYEEEEASSSLLTEGATHVKPHERPDGEPFPGTPSLQPQWRPSMYGIDEDDLVHLNEEQTPIVEEEDGRMAANVSNPWTIARMNATVKPTKTTFNTQLLSPVKSLGEIHVRSSSPVAHTTSPHAPQVTMLTPQTSPRINRCVDPLTRAITHQTQQQLSGEPLRTMYINDENTIPDVPSTSKAVTRGANSTLPKTMTRASYALQKTPHASPRKQKPDIEQSAATSAEGPDDTWFGQPMRGSQALQSPHKPQREKKRQPRLGHIDASTNRFAPSAEPLVETTLYSEKNTDIREFFGHGRAAGPGDEQHRSSEPSFESSDLVSKKISLNGGILPQRGPGASHQQRPLSQPSNTGTYQISGPGYSPTWNGHSDAPYVMRPSTVDSDHRSLPTGHSADTQMHIEKERHKDIRQSNHDMAAYFKAYQDREEPFVDQAGSPTRRSELRVPPPHEHASYSRPQRCRTTEELQRTKSSKLPLERVPHGDHLQHITLRLSTSIVYIIQNASHLNMHSNSLDWPYPATADAYKAFVEPITATKIMSWVVQLDAKLAESFEPLPGADVRSLLHEAIQRGMDEKQDDWSMDTRPTVTTSTPVVDLTTDGDIPSGAVRENTRSPLPDTTKAEGERSSFNMSQFFDLDAALSDDIEPITKSVQETTREGGDEEFEDTLEDDMLLDL